VHYLARVGLDHAKKAVVEDAANRKALYERLLFAVQGYEDPWQQRAKQPAMQREYELLAI
jgi:nitrite reductase (NADH) large subunit